MPDPTAPDASAQTDPCGDAGTAATPSEPQGLCRTANDSPRTGVLILAAGAGSRMGGRAKCLLEVQGRSLLSRLVASVRALGLEPLLVLGHHGDEIRAHLSQWPAHDIPPHVVNPSPASGPASSLRTGLRALGDEVDAVMVLLADQPLINAADIAAVVAAFRLRPPGCAVLIPTAAGVPGHPLMFDAAVRADLLANGLGLREWRAGHPNATLHWRVDNDHYTRDIDTPEDLDVLARETGWRLGWPSTARLPS